MCKWFKKRKTETAKKTETELEIYERVKLQKEQEKEHQKQIDRDCAEQEKKQKHLDSLIYGVKVKILDGFYKGQRGTVIKHAYVSMSNSYAGGSDYLFTIRLTSTKDEVSVFPDVLEIIEPKKKKK